MEQLRLVARDDEAGRRLVRSWLAPLVKIAAGSGDDSLARRRRSSCQGPAEEAGPGGLPALAVDGKQGGDLGERRLRNDPAVLDRVRGTVRPITGTSPWIAACPGNKVQWPGWACLALGRRR